MTISLPVIYRHLPVIHYISIYVDNKMSLNKLLRRRRRRRRRGRRRRRRRRRNMNTKRLLFTFCCVFTCFYKDVPMNGSVLGGQD